MRVADALVSPSSGHHAGRARFAVGLLGLAALCAIVWLTLWAAVAPRAFGWSSVAVTSGSMEPLIATGDVVVLAPYAGEDLTPGTVIMFAAESSSGTVVHRVVAVTPDGDYVTRGDANGRIDSTPVSPDQIVGVGRMLVPTVGAPIMWAREGSWLPLLLLGLGILGCAWASRWAVIARFDPWRGWTGCPPEPGPATRRWKPQLAAATVVVVASVGVAVVTTARTSATLNDVTDNGANSMIADTLQPPTALSATGGAAVTLTWTVTPDTYASGHRIFRATSSGGPYAQIAQTTPRATASFVDSPPAGTYFYVVRAYAANWESVNSNEGSATVAAAEDFDAVPAVSDNCPSTFNIDQYDTDGDGTGDACDPSSTVASSGLFTDSGQTLGSGDSGGVVFGDVDGDGDLDVMFGNGGANKVLFNDGSGTFTDSGQSLGSGDGEGLAMGDLDGDGDLDAFTANDSLQANRVWFNNGAGTFTDSGQALGNSDSWHVALGDLDGDGDLDAMVANNGQANRVWFNNGAGTFTDSGQALGTNSSRRIAFGDVDGDGDLDAVVANNGQANRVWLNDGAGVFTDSGQALGGSNSRGVALADVDGDGDLDALFANSGANKVWVNNGAGIFSDSGQNLGAASSNGVAIGDLDGDGDLDALFANSGANKVWLNNGVGVFSDSGQALGASTSYDVVLGDVDGDGDLDAVTANSAANRLWINDT